MDTYVPTAPPRTDNACWPMPCRDYHETAAHIEGFDPCACSCHADRQLSTERDAPIVPESELRLLDGNR